MTLAIVPYADNKSMKLGGVTVENGPDCVSVYGSVDYTMDQVGLAAAQEMKTLIEAVISNLESQPSLPAALPVVPVGHTKNPFA